MIEREGWEVWLPCYEEDEIPVEIETLYDDVTALARVFCEKICKCFDCDGGCDLNILINMWDKKNPEVIGVIPKNAKIDLAETTFRLNLGWCYSASLTDFWEKFKEDILPFV